MNIFELNQSLSFDFSPEVKPNWIVYFLIRRGNVVYVGKTTACGFKGRLSSHARDKDFDGYWVINHVADENLALKIESGFIALCHPEYNTNGKTIDRDLIKFILDYGQINCRKLPPNSSDPVIFEGTVYKNMESFKGSMRKSKSRGKVKKYERMKKYLESIESKN